MSLLVPYARPLKRSIKPDWRKLDAVMPASQRPYGLGAERYIECL